MFCSNCGAEATGNFCWRCGTALAGAPAPGPAPPGRPAAPPPSGPPQPGPPPPPSAARTDEEWAHETRYEALVAIPEVRERIARNADLAETRMTGEEFLALADKIGGKAGLLPVPVAPVAELVQPIYEDLGVQTGKKRAERVPWPVGRVLVAVLCSLARRDMDIRSVRQADDGCVVEAEIPSDVRSFGGTLVVTVGAANGATDVEAATKIGGQLFDWGKSARCLRELYADIAELAPADVVA